MFSKILLSDALGAGSRPFTMATSLPVVGGVTIINIGPSAYNTPGSDPDLLIHEATHSWQSQHHPIAGQYMVNSVASQAAAAIAGGSAYCYVPGRLFAAYGAEQIAQQVENGVAAIVSHVSAVPPLVNDPTNVVGLAVPHWEKPGDPGVQC